MSKWTETEITRLLNNIFAPGRPGNASCLPAIKLDFQRSVRLP
jgi:hypothetical protein